jgi:transitional endoplasmic reticulum ATPase
MTHTFGVTMAKHQLVFVPDNSPFESTVLPIVKLWTLRMMVRLGGHKNLDQLQLSFNDGLETLFSLGGGREPFAGTHSIKCPLPKLRWMHEACERDVVDAKLPDCLARNLERLAKLAGLSEADCRILAFTVLLQTDQLLAAASTTFKVRSSLQLTHALSVLLNFPAAEIRNSLGESGVLIKSGLLSVDRSSGSHSFDSLSEKLSLQSINFADHMVCMDADPITLLRDTIAASAAPELALSDFAHIAPSLSVLRPYLQHAATAKRRGVNIFLHGQPGTGKSQLAKVLAKELACELFEVASQDEHGDAVDGMRRLQAFRSTQYFLATRQALVLFDESEDIFDDGDQKFGRKSTAQTRKAWINRMLEDNAVPTIWLSNSVGGLDAAFVRRFDMVFELPVPPKSQRARIIQAACGGLLDATRVARIAESESLTPAVVARAASVVQTILSEMAQPGAMGAADAIEMLVGNTLQAQGHATIRRNDPNRLPDLYDPAFIHADADLVQLAAGLVQTQSGRLCLYGPPGTGKTAFGRWLAEQMGAPLMVKRASDLMSMWVGGSEKNLARAFKQAEQQGALLLIDEVDSFLQDRRGAKASWEVTQVNEMLTQMESYPGVFIASTNLMAGLDQAALRRFDLKVKFDFLQPHQAWALLGRQCESLALGEPAPQLQAQINAIGQLTPGDFAAVVRQHRFRPFASAGDFVAALAAECGLKEGGRSSMGFV